MPSATPTATTANTVSGQAHHATGPISFKHEVKPFSTAVPELLDPSSSSSSGPIRIDGYEQDLALSRSEYLTRSEVLNRRARRLKQLAGIYRDHYWALMEELKLKYREYYWDYGKSPFVEDEEIDKNNSARVDCSSGNAENGSNGSNGVNFVNNPGRRCEVNGCKGKAMALAKFCHMHILTDGKQKLYKPCSFSIKSSTSGPILCGKPILRSTNPSYCPLHFQKAEKHLVQALKKAGLNISTTSKLAPKIHVIITEYVRLIQQKRRAVRRENLGNDKAKEERS